MYCSAKHFGHAADFRRVDARLLSQVAQPRKSTAVPDPEIEREFGRRLGHSNPNFPPSEHQRQVLTYLDLSIPGDVFAVNGPPGTGSTTMLLSAGASVWIRAALKGEDAPIIVAASTNNQAVTNKVDAFGKDFARGEVLLGGGCQISLALEFFSHHTPAS